MVFRISCDDGKLEMFDEAERKVIRLTAEGWGFTDKGYKFHFPVDETFSGVCRGLSYGVHLTFIRREADYEPLEEIVPGRDFSLESDRYIIEINAHIKVYASIDSAITVKADSQKIEMDFGGERDVIFGVRSFHRSPSATITTTGAFRDLAKAISLLSSSLKTYTCERSYPTLRGHPPLIQIGDELSIPEGLEKPESGVVVSVPKKLSYLYVASPLIYYLMADVEFGEPGIYCDSNFEHSLPPRFPEFEEKVAEALRRVFFLDCFVRCAGVYLKEIKEMEAIEGMGLDIKDLFSKRVSEQLPVYFDVPWERLERHIPEWHLSYYVKPALRRLRALPFILNELALVRLPRYTKVSMREVTESALKDFFRGNIFQMLEEKSLTKPILDQSQSHVWLSPETPIGVAKASTDAFYNQLKYLGREKEKIEIALVLNDEKMGAETRIVRGVYGRRKDIPLRIKMFDFLSKEELIRVFSEGFDLVHYIGHCDKSGFVCSDGGLKIKGIENNTSLFFLNACNSYEEGADLLRSGSVGGVVTLFRVMNEEAVDIGCTFSRLLSTGFPLGKAMELATLSSVFGKDYLVLGNSEYRALQEEKFSLPASHIVRRKGDKFLVTYKVHAQATGGFFTPYTGDRRDNYLFFSDPVFEITLEELENLTKTHAISPFIYRGQLYWGEDLLVEIKKRDGERSPLMA